MSNHMTVRGRLGQDAEQKSTASGTTYVSFSLASDVGWGDKKETMWVRCTIWGNRGEKLLQYLTKGTAICALGEASLRTWQDNQGANRTDLQLNCHDVWLIGQKPQAAQATAAAPVNRAAPAPVRAQPANGAPGAYPPPPHHVFNDDDIAF